MAPLPFLVPGVIPELAMFCWIAAAALALDSAFVAELLAAVALDSDLVAELAASFAED